MFINTHLQHLDGNYLFTEIANRTQEYQQNHPDAQVLRLGIGDVTLPLPQVIIDAMHRAVDELASAATFRGYGPEEGYLWLRQAIVDNDYTSRGIHVSPEDVFISDGAGSDLGNLSELFDASNSVAILEPSYPAYVDTSRMAGREIIWLPCLAQNNFYPALPKQKADIIYLCFPNKNMRGRTIASSSLTPRTKPSSKILTCPIASTRSRVLRKWRSRYAVSARLPVLRPCAAAIRWFRKQQACKPCGCADSVPSSTELLISPNGLLRLPIPPKEKPLFKRI